MSLPGLKALFLDTDCHLFLGNCRNKLASSSNKEMKRSHRKEQNGRRTGRKCTTVVGEEGFLFYFGFILFRKGRHELFVKSNCNGRCKVSINF